MLDIEVVRELEKRSAEQSCELDKQHQSEVERKRKKCLISQIFPENDMKAKLKEKFNVHKKAAATFTKCVKMSKEVENLKNGILNGESLLSHIQHQQQKQSKLGNSNADRDSKSIVGGRLQFYKGE